MSDTPLRSELSILVVDDTPAYQKLITSLLERHGHRARSASDGREALERFRNERFDVIVLDVQLPVTSGYEVAKKIRELERSAEHRTGIIALTANSLASDREACLAAGMDAHLAKPIDASQLIELVEKIASRTRTNGAAGHAENAVVDIDDGMPIIDFDGAMTRLGGDVELFQEFIHVFDEDVPTLRQSLRQGIESRDQSTVERMAHSLRGMISNFGARRAVETAGEMEELAKTARWPEIDSLMPSLEQEIDRVSEALSQYRSKER